MYDLHNDDARSSGRRWSPVQGIIQRQLLIVQPTATMENEKETGHGGRRFGDPRKKEARGRGGPAQPPAPKSMGILFAA